MHATLLLLLSAALAASLPAASAQQPDTATLLAGKVEAMKAFAMIDGVWRGPATAIQPDGSRLGFVQTERIEVGDRVVAGQEPTRVFEMRLKRVSDSDWPAAGAIAPK